MSRLYHEGHRQLQDEFGSRRLADRIEEKLARTAFTEGDREFIEGSLYFFLATADAEGRPDCSFKGGVPGFVRVTGPAELAFPDYDGNGMFRSLGNVLVNPHVGLLFIALHGQPRRLRVNGTAVVHRDDPLLAPGGLAGAQLIVRVTVSAIFPNCPRYLPTLELASGSASPPSGASPRVEPSVYAPRAGHEPPEPGWKSHPELEDAVPPRRRR